LTVVVAVSSMGVLLRGKWAGVPKPSPGAG
jgi:hypothetical protein